MHRKPIELAGLIVILLTLGMGLTWGQEKPRFTVKDDIRIAKFGYVVVSPNGNMAAVQTERASLQDGLMHETFIVYDLKAVREAVNAPDGSAQLAPKWSFERAVKDFGSGYSVRVWHLKWLANGTGFAFLLQEDQYHHRLYLAKIASKEVVPLSAPGDDVLGFDIRDRYHYVFTVASHEAESKLREVLKAPYRVGTGHYFDELAYPELYSHIIQRGDLWGATGGSPKPVRDRTTGAPISFFSAENWSLALSPDGKTLVALLPVPNVSADWVRSYPPPYPDDDYGLKAHHQDLTAAVDGWSYVGEWARISLDSGRAISLTNAPASGSAGWLEVYARPAWSDDGSSILLPGTFDANQHGSDIRPCVSVVRLDSAAAECVTALNRNLATSFETGYAHIDNVTFVRGNKDRVALNRVVQETVKTITEIYARSAEGIWHLEETKPDVGWGSFLDLQVRETFKDPPVLVATDPVSGKSKVILDPNLQLKNIAFGESELYSWQDKSGHTWQGILYKPVGYSPNVRYPLVIQNHGFSPNRYVPSGEYPSAFVAQELASAGIMVLQVRDCDGRSTPAEGPCNVREYENAVEKLSKDGFIDPSRVGIIGFSRTVYYVLEALTTSNIRFKAASITDGVSYSYTNYLESVDQPGAFNAESVVMMGAQPFGAGLAKWLQSSPVFNLDKVTTPLRVVSGRDDDVPSMWEPYALLRAMHKPVDLIVLNTQEHPIADPVMRLIAQGGNVDWFRFWLQGYEDPDPAKQEQYARWGKLRDSVSREQQRNKEADGGPCGR